MLAILDYKAGNQTSVARALNFLKVPCVITDSRNEVANAKGIIFPGVGAAGQAMQNLQSTGMGEVLIEAVSRGIPVLGICLGCQIMLEASAENNTRTLGIVPGECLAFDPAWQEENGERIRVPHMGWNSLKVQRPSALFKGIEPEAQFYFVHSYYPCPAGEFVLATTYYGREFCSVYGKDALWAVQFHPEKSGRPGLRLLRNFYDYCVEGRDAE
ncbi:MAG: imidazole glycerol phosphate synthase subunit HisH [Desulfovibrionaceae bacterium]|nr:imidazole glycerol phosphate synthase subunit HisH [Desulfovibrionaceae bacterium]